MQKMHLKFYDSVHDFFEETHVTDVKKYTEGMKSENRYQIERCSQNDDRFHGNHEKLYKKYKNHDVKKEAGIMSGVLSDINTADFEEQKWEFRQRLEEGDVIDINRYLDGQEKFWAGVKRVMRTKQVVRVYFNIGGNCNRSAEELAVSGALAVTLTEILESMGIGVELWGCGFSTTLACDEEDRDVNGGTLIKLKASDEFSDLGMINYVCGNSHVFRNQMFISWCKMCHEHNLVVYDNLGHCRDASLSDIGLTEEEAENAIVIPHFYTVPEAKQWLIDIFNNLKETLRGKKKEEAK